YNKTGATWADGDFDGNGTVNFTDLLTLTRNYNKTLAAPAAAVTDVQAVTAAVGAAVSPATPARPTAPPTQAKKPPVNPKPAPKPAPVIRAVAPPVVVK